MDRRWQIEADIACRDGSVTSVLLEPALDVCRRCCELCADGINAQERVDSRPVLGHPQARSVAFCELQARWQKEPDVEDWVDRVTTGFGEQSGLDGRLPLDARFCHHFPDLGSERMFWVAEVEDGGEIKVPGEEVGVGELAGRVHALLTEGQKAGISIGLGIFIPVALTCSWYTNPTNALVARPITSSHESCLRFGRGREVAEVVAPEEEDAS